MTLRTLLLSLALFASACSSSEDGGCKTDSDCKGDRICEQGSCVSPGGSGGSGGFGGSGTGGFGAGSSTATGGMAGCAAECKTPAGTCCAGAGVCEAVPPCLGNPCCSN